MSKHQLDRLSQQNIDDEIDLVQLFQILWRRKILIIIIASICLLCGIGYALFRTPIYEYVTAIQIGTALVDEGSLAQRTSIEAPPSVKLKLEKVYLPMATNQIKSKYGDRLPVAIVKENKDSNILLITSKGSFDDGQFLKELHTAIVSPLIINHREQVAASKKQYEIFSNRAKLTLKDLEDPRIYGAEENALKGKIEAAQLALAGIDDQNKNLLSEKKGLLETKQLLLPQIRQIEKNLKVSYVKRDNVISEVEDEAKAMTFLMLNSDIQHNENRLAALRERLNVKLANQKQQIEGKLAENQRLRHLQLTMIDELKSQLVHLQAQRSSDQDKQKSKIAEAENKKNLYQETRALNIAQRSIKPVGMGKVIIVLLSGILGLLIGIMAAFFAEFMMAMRETQKSQS